jgi:hypothetical protein
VALSVETRAPRKLLITGSQNVFQHDLHVFADTSLCLGSAKHEGNCFEFVLRFLRTVMFQEIVGERGLEISFSAMGAFLGIRPYV